MSWRRFVTLLRGLGPYSVTMLSGGTAETVGGTDSWTEDRGPLGKYKALTAADMAGFKVIKGGGK